MLSTLQPHDLGAYVMSYDGRMYTVEIDGLKRDLPIFEVAPNVKIALFNMLGDTEVVEASARGFEPHQVAYYLRELANSFHTYYNAHPFIASESSVRDARLTLIDATRQVLHNGLELIGVSAPESM